MLPGGGRLWAGAVLVVAAGVAVYFMLESGEMLHLKASGGAYGLGEPHRPADLAPLNPAGAGAPPGNELPPDQREVPEAAPTEEHSPPQEPLEETNLPSHWVSGTVTGPDGRPLARVPVLVALQINAQGGRIEAVSHTNAEGGYEALVREALQGTRVTVRIDVGLDGPTRWSHAEPAERVVEPGATNVDFELVSLPAVRVRVVDAHDGRPLPDARPEGWYAEPDGDALVIYLEGRMGSRRATLGVEFELPGYLPHTAWLTPPAEGVTEVAEPVRLERGISAAGSLVSANGFPLSGWVFADPLHAESPMAPVVGSMASTDGTWELPPLRAGRYRLLSLVAGHPPSHRTLNLAPSTEPLKVVMPKPGAWPAPAPRRFTWDQRHDLRIPVWITTPHAAELVRWLEEIADAPIELRDNAAATLATTAAPALKADTQLDQALREIGNQTTLQVDPVAGVFSAADD